MASPTVPFPLIPNQPDVEFRFTIKTARLLERATRPWGGIAALSVRGNNVEVLIAVALHAMLWNKPKLTEDKVIDLIQAFVDNGGDVIALTNTLTKALEDSGVYGQPAKPEEEIPEGDEDPSTATTETLTT